MKNYLDSVQEILLLGAGPSGIAPATYHALARPTLGHLDPYFIEIMEDVKSKLRTLMQTENDITLPLSGTGSLGMETSFVNTIEPEDNVLILENGVFGLRMADVAERLGANVTHLAFPWGTPVVVDAVRQEMQKKDYKIVAVVHAETSTGVRNPVAEVGELVKETDALYLVDTVTSLGGIPVALDKWHVDVCYSGTQKCISCPPGLSPASFSEKAMNVIRNRTHKVPNWYADLNLLTQYWSSAKRTYHHTAPINMVYGLYQALYNILEESPERVFARHQAAHERLVVGLDRLGMQLLVEPEYRLPELNTVLIPEGVDETVLRRRLLSEYHIEISAGLGVLAGKVIRIGLMGYNATDENVDRLLAAMEDILTKLR